MTFNRALCRMLKEWWPERARRGPPAGTDRADNAPPQRVRTWSQTSQSRNDSFCAKFIEMAQKHFLTVLNLDEAILLGLYRG